VEFVWTAINVTHLATHEIGPDEAEYIVERGQPPYPQMIGKDKRLVIGQLPDGRHVQVIYVPSRSVRGAVYVMHARPLTEREKRRFRRRRR